MNNEECKECPMIEMSQKLIEVFTGAIKSFDKLYELFRLSLLALIIISMGKTLSEIIVGFIK